MTLEKLLTPELQSQICHIELMAELVKVGFGVFTIILGIIAAWGLRRLWANLFTEYDRSALIRIEISEGQEPEAFSNWPILNGALPFKTFDGVTVPDVQTNDVVGFIEGTPVKIPDLSARGLTGWTPGYYAYAVIHWNKYEEVKRLVQRGYYLQQTFLTDEEGKPRQQSETRFLRFATGASGQQGIAEIIEGFGASFRFQPYKKLGFKSTDIGYRKMTPQAKLAQKIWG